MTHIDSIRSTHAAAPPSRGDETAGERSDVRDYRALQDRVLARYGVAGSSYFVGADTARPVHVLEAGDGHPLVLLHGGGGNAALWAKLLAPLQHGFRCLAVDRPGHGLSYRVDYRDVADYRADAAAFVERTLDLLGLERATLVGNSMGGFFSLAFALAHPERVERLVLVGSPAGIDRWVPLPLRLLGTAGLGAVLWKTVARPTPANLRGLFRDALVADDARVSEAEIACAVAGQTLPGGGVAWLSLLRSFLTLRGVADACYLRDELPAIEAPTLFAWGERDAFAPPSSGERACASMKRAQLEVIPGAGHMPWMDAPRASAAAIERFVAG